MLLALLSAFALSQAYRTVAAILALPLQAELQLTPQQLGVFAGTFHLAFGAMQLFMGVGIDVYGVRRTILTAFPLAAAGAALASLAPGYGTLLLAQTGKTQARKQWMADHLQLRGAVTVDAGAAAKLRREGKSLLPIGMTAVEGDFSRGDVIAVRDPAGAELARGLANYASAEARLLCRKPSSEFQRLLGYMAEPEMVHRDNLVLTAAA